MCLVKGRDTPEVGGTPEVDGTPEVGDTPEVDGDYNLKKHKKGE